MKKILILLLAALLAAMAGCGQGPEKSSFTAENEIFTYEKIDPEKTQLVVSRTGNIEIDAFCEAFEERSPDVQIIYLDITGGNAGCTPAVDWVKNGLSPDVMFTSSGFFTPENCKEFFENLSASPVIENYEAAALKRTSVDAEVYRLPGPSNIICMLYNKTLFEEYGWPVPASFDEFVELCLRIREDTNGEVEPWNPNAKYSNELDTALEAFCYEELFGGLENRRWYNDFISGNAKFAGHMEPFYEVVATLVESGILKEEHFSYSATTRGQEFAAGKIAMINVPASDLDNADFDFGFMPFPTTSGELGYICDNYSCFLSIPKKERTDAKNDAVDRFVEFFSTPEGQLIFIGDAIRVSNVKGVSLNQSDDLASLGPAIEAGHMFERIDFAGEQGRPNFGLYRGALDMTTDGKTAEECLAAVDAQPYLPDEESAAPEVIAEAEDMTILETSFYIADAYRETAGADVALIANNAAYRGNLMRVFAGDITSDFVAVLKPRSFENGSTLIKAKMTGKQLTDAMNTPPGYNGETLDCVYAYSGLKCEIAPWRPLGEKYLSIKLADGSRLEPEKEYTVAFWSGTVSEEFISEILETYDASFEDILSAKMSSDGVKPAGDSRCKLVWE